MKEKLKTIPVPLLAAMVGSCTLSNAYLGLGYTWIRHMIFIATICVVIAYSCKLLIHFATCVDEYKKTPMCALYAGFPMCLMLIGSYVFDLNPMIGKTLWLVAVFVDAIHILVFTYRNVLRGVKTETFVPSWFVTYNGIMVSTVIGGAMNEPLISKIVVYYGITVFTVIIPFMVWRLATKPISDALYHTQPVVLAPCSLCIVSYLNVFKNPKAWVVYYLYIAVVIALLFIIYKLPSFFRYSFTPGFTGMTFPMAIGCVATTKFMGYMQSQGFETAVSILKEVQGIQILTTGIIFYVLIQYLFF
ncbi:Exfoliative toxin A [Lachnospiraceae bacterium TWA4]|nr:Exfoliative toxin A [Lachnospiraceae bacterium TWA4]